MAKGGTAHIATGKHDRETFIRLFFVLYRHQRSGVLNVRFGKRERNLFLLGGEPVGYRSDLPEDDIGRTLVNANLVPEKQMNWVREKLSEGEHLEEAIMMAGALTDEALQEHKTNRLRVNVGSPLLWGSGDWSFTPTPRIKSGQVDPELRPNAHALAAMWHAVEQHVSMDAVFPAVTDPKAGAVVLDPLCNALFSAIEVDEVLSKLPEVIEGPTAVDDIFRKVSDSSGNLVKLLWFLEAAGLIHREGRTTDETLEKQIASACKAAPAAAETAAAAQPTAKPSSAKKGSAKPSSAKKGSARKDAPAENERKSSGKRTSPDAPSDDQIRAEHRKRMGRDFYAFLSLPPNSPNQSIDRKCKSLARRWRAAANEREVSAEVKEKIDELLEAVQLVWRTLTDPKHREEYDRRLSAGRAPKVGDLRRASEAPEGGADSAGLDGPDIDIEEDEEENEVLSTAEALIEKKDFEGALKILKRARMDDPSSPDIMAALGWTTWNIHGASNGDAEEFLRLALTFDANHAKGIEYLARVRVALKDFEMARKLCQKLLKVAPDSKWARTALRNLNRSQS